MMQIISNASLLEAIVIGSIFFVSFLLYKHVIFIRAYWNFPRLKQLGLWSMIKLFSLKSSNSFQPLFRHLRCLIIFFLFSDDIRGQFSFVGKMANRGEGWIVLGLPLYPVIITYEPSINKVSKADLIEFLSFHSLSRMKKFLLNYLGRKF